MSIKRPFLLAANLLTGFFHWWLSELAGLIPAHLRRIVSSDKERLLIDLQGERAVLYRRRRREIQPIGQLARQNDDRFSLPPHLLGKRRRWRATLLVPQAMAMTRDVRLPTAALENLRDVIGFEMDRLSPFGRDELYYDFSLVHHDKRAQRLQAAVTLVPRRLLDPVLADLAEAGLTVDQVDISGDTPGAPRGLNVLPHSDARQISRPAGVLAAMFVLGAVTLTGLAVSISLDRKAGYAAALKQQVMAARTRAIAAEELQSEIATLAQRDIYVVDLKRARPSMSHLLDTVTRLLPDDSWLVQLRINDSRLDMVGYSPRSAALIGVYENAPDFAEVRFASPVTPDPRLSVERFNLSATVRGLKEAP